MLNTKRLQLMFFVVFLFSGFAVAQKRGGKPATQTNHALFLVDGIFGDFIGDNFEQIRFEWSKMSPLATTRVIRPSSFRSLQENSKFVAKELERFSKEIPTSQKLIVLAHSRGAVETALSFMSRPQLAKATRVSQVVMLQGAFEGSPFAEIGQIKFEDLCHQKSSLFNDAQLQMLGFIDIEAICKNAKRLLGAVQTLVPARTRALVADHVDSMDVEQRQVIQNLFTYVRSSSDIDQMPWMLKPSGYFLERYYGESDGVVLTSEQKIKGLGVDLGVWSAHHIELSGVGYNVQRQRHFLNWLNNSLRVLNRL